MNAAIVALNNSTETALMATQMLMAPVPGSQHQLGTGASRIIAYERGNGSPLVLVHGVNAMASAAEVRPIQEMYYPSRRVFCFDLPGFGLSSRGDYTYSARKMTDALQTVVEFVKFRTGYSCVDALALGLSCEFLARAAAERPHSYRTLAFIGPTGLSRRVRSNKPDCAGMGSPLLYALLHRPGWGAAIFHLRTTPYMIRRALQRAWGSSAINEELWLYDIGTTRQPGAEFAPLYFWSGQLFSSDMPDIYHRLQMPIWMVRGVRAGNAHYRQEPTVVDRANWRSNAYSTGAFPHFEDPELFRADYDAFLQASPPIRSRKVS
jgi:pimeloyl-ACP methyl ester carboxylesterase